MLITALCKQRQIVASAKALPRALDNDHVNRVVVLRPFHSSADLARRFVVDRVQALGTIQQQTGNTRCGAVWLNLQGRKLRHHTFLQSRVAQQDIALNRARAKFNRLNNADGNATVIALSLKLLRGLALSGMLRTSSARREQLINQWLAAARILLEVPPVSRSTLVLNRSSSSDQAITFKL